MDERTIALKEKLERLIEECAKASVESDWADGTIEGVPHYSAIEARAHELGRQLSRSIQRRHMGQVASGQSLRRRCPRCGKVCEVNVMKRDVTSIDGPVDLPELKGSCPACRRDFFPSA
jgi:hypothetical protein